MRQLAARWGWAEVFVLILFLMNGLLLLPGTQPLRFAIRALPYAASFGSLLLIRRSSRVPLPPGAIAMQFALLLLAVNLLHPETQPKSGVAQVVFQASIVGPVFWAGGLVKSERRLLRVLWLVFACNAVGAALGILQIYFPEHFLPAEFSTGASASWLQSLAFTSPSGKLLVRPPGLSDLPGGAAMSGSLTAILGLAFSSLRGTKLALRFACLAAALTGISVLYLTQVRSLTLMTLASMAMLGLFAATQKRIWNRGWMMAAAGFVVVGSFTWAVAAGGDKVRDRFLNLSDHGVADTYGESRGWFWQYTFGEALDRYVLGAGPGRWGMMDVYFGDPARPDSPALWAEIQPTGWLYDGGVPLWILYGAGLMASMLFAFRVACSPRYGPAVPFAAAVVFCINANVIGASLSGPAFNTTMGLQYWLLVAFLYGAARTSWRGPSLQQRRFHHFPALELPQGARA